MGSPQSSIWIANISIAARWVCPAGFLTHTLITESAAEMAGDFIDARGFVHVTDRAGLQALQEAFVVGGGAGDHEDWNIWSGGFDLGNQFVAGAVGQREVEHDQVEAGAEMFFCLEQRGCV